MDTDHSFYLKKKNVSVSMTTNQILQKGATMEFPLEEVARAIKIAVRLYMVSYFAFTFRKYSLYCTCVLQSCVCHDGGQLNNSFKKSHMTDKCVVGYGELCLFI